MRAVYRTCFEIRAKSDGGELFSDVAEHVWRWIFDRKELGIHRRPTEAKGAATLLPLKVGTNFEIESLSVEDSGLRTWGLALRQNELHDEKMFWVSEITLSQSVGKPCYFSFAQMVGRRDGSFTPMRRAPGRPRIIRTLIQEFPAISGGLRLVGQPFQIRATNEDMDRFMRILESPGRTHPALFVSVHLQSQTHLIKATELADHLCGIAQVFVAENLDVAHLLSARLPRWLNCFDGAIRIYWPGFHRRALATEHRLWTANDLANDVGFDSGRFADRALAQIAEVSVFSVSPNFCSWQQVQTLDRRRAIDIARQNQNWQPLAEELDKDNQAKVAEIAALREELRNANDLLFKERQISATYRQVFEDRKAGKATDTEEQLPVQSVTESIERALKSFVNELAFALNGRSKPDSPYEAPEEVYLAFQWLATIYRDSRLGVKSCPDLDQSLAALISGWHYSAHQKEATMKANEAWYRCMWNGTKIWIPEHLKAGTSRDAEESIRIAFAWDANTQKVIIGFIGQHQKNTKT